LQSSISALEWTSIEPKFQAWRIMRHELKTMMQDARPIDDSHGAPSRPDLAVTMAGKRDERDQDPGGPGTSVIAKTRPQTKRPSLYRVLLLNDDYTPMEFVVHILENVLPEGLAKRRPGSCCTCTSTASASAASTRTRLRKPR
jgi:hypothetical protein